MKSNCKKGNPVAHSLQLAGIGYTVPFLLASIFNRGVLTRCDPWKLYVSLVETSMRRLVCCTCIADKVGLGMAVALGGIVVCKDLAKDQRRDKCIYEKRLYRIGNFKSERVDCVRHLLLWTSTSLSFSLSLTKHDRSID